MTRVHLLACPECARHVRVDEDACPFRRAALPSWFRERTLPPTPAARLSRAALHALRVGALSVTTAACGTSGAPVVQPPDGGPFPPGDSGSSADGAQPVDSGQAVDSGPSDAGALPDVADSSQPDATDAATLPDHLIAPPYGIPLYGAPP
jgi:hypothetical protein